MTRSLLLIASAVCAAMPAWTASYYTQRLEDPKAVYLTRDHFAVKGDGVADDTDALQRAINRVQETTDHGILFVPEGRYRLTKNLYVWPGIRLIGFGANRPVFVLGPNTPGYQDANNESYMVFFAGWRPGVKRSWGEPDDPDSKPSDATPGTFYSAISNIDIEIGDGNPGAVGVRGRYAQHCFLAHMDFRIGSGIAGVHESGNVMEDVRFYGGRYGLWTQKPTPGWQLTLVDAVFEGQREAAILEREAGLTLIRPHFKNVPTAIAIEPDRSDELWVKDARMEDISGPAVIISRENGAQTEINMEGVVCRNVPVFALLRDSGRKIPGSGSIYAVKTFSHGLHIADAGAVPETKTAIDAAPLGAMPPAVKSDLPDLPPRDTWIDVRSLGARGDGKTDDTEALRKAVARHRSLYFPSGKYIISDTLVLRPDTVLIALHPNVTQIDLKDSTPAFQGVGGPKPMLEAPQGGTNIVIGIGLYTNAINPRAVALKWMAGKDSLVNDVRFHGGHGTSPIEGEGGPIYNNTHTADPDLQRRWDGQYSSLWVTNGGGGTFFDIWTPSPFAQAGMLISDTSTEGRVYEMSSEHHVRYEVQLRNVSNWHIYALQTEEERGESGFALPLEIVDSSDITIANLHMYRVISTFQPFPWAVKVSNSRNIRFRNVHTYSNSKVSFDTSVYDQTHNVEVRQREFAWLTLSGLAPKPRPTTASAVLAAGSKVQKLANGFYNISGGAVDPAGDYYFVDAHWQRIHRWASKTSRLSTIRDNPLDPINLAIDTSGNILVLSYAGNGTVYTFKPGSPDGEISLLKPQAAAARPGMTAWLPVSDWRVATDAASGLPAPRPFHYVSPDGSTYLPVTEGFVRGESSWGVKSSDVLRSFGMAPAVPGKPFYITEEATITTYQVSVGADGSLSGVKRFAEQGGESTAVDAQGNVYIAAGHIYVYSSSGRLLETIEVPERPTHIAFGGEDGRTLFIAARTSLYAVRTKQKGR